MNYMSALQARQKQLVDPAELCAIADTAAQRAVEYIMYEMITFSLMSDPANMISLARQGKYAVSKQYNMDGIFEGVALRDLLLPQAEQHAMDFLSETYSQHRGKYVVAFERKDANLLVTIRWSSVVLRDSSSVL